MPWPRVRIAVLKRAVFEDICKEYGSNDFLDRGGCGPCGQFQDGQEFILDHSLDMPENFCTYAFADIRHELMVVPNGRSQPYVRAEGTAIATNRCPSSGSSAQDAMKPVLFKIERIEEPQC